MYYNEDGELVKDTVRKQFIISLFCDSAQFLLSLKYNLQSVYGFLFRTTMTTATIRVLWKDTQNGRPLWLPVMDSSEDQGGVGVSCGGNLEGRYVHV